MRTPHHFFLKRIQPRAMPGAVCFQLILSVVIGIVFIGGGFRLVGFGSFGLLGSGGLLRLGRLCGLDFGVFFHFRVHAAHDDGDDRKEEYDGEHARRDDQPDIGIRSICGAVVRGGVVARTEVVLLHGHVRRAVVEEHRRAVLQVYDLFAVRRLRVRTVGIAQFVLVFVDVVAEIIDRIIEGEGVVEGVLEVGIGILGIDEVRLILFEFVHCLAEQRVVIGGGFGGVCIEEHILARGEAVVLVGAAACPHFEAVVLFLAARLHIEHNFHPAVVARVRSLDLDGGAVRGRIRRSGVTHGDAFVGGEGRHGLRVGVVARAHLGAVGVGAVLVFIRRVVVEGDGAVARHIVALFVALVVGKVRVVHDVLVALARARLIVEPVVGKVVEHVLARVEVVARGILVHDVAVVVVPVGDGGDVGRQRIAVSRFRVRGIDEVHRRRRAFGELHAHGDALCGVCGDRLRRAEDVSVRRRCRIAAVVDEEGLVGDAGAGGAAAERSLPPCFAVCVFAARFRHFLERVHPVFVKISVGIGILRIEHTRIDARRGEFLARGVGGRGIPVFAGIEHVAARLYALEGDGLCKFFLDIRGRGGGVELRVVVHAARKGDLLCVVGRRRIAVLRGGHRARLKSRERRVAVRIGGELRSRNLGGAVVEFEREGLLRIRFVGYIEEAPYPAVVDVGRVVVDVNRIGGVGVECRNGRAVFAVHKGDGGARRAAADVARLYPEGDEHVFVFFQRKGIGRAELRGVRRSVGGEEEEHFFAAVDRPVRIREGESAPAFGSEEVLFDDVLKIQVAAVLELIEGVIPRHAPSAHVAVVAVVLDLGGVRLAARDLFGDARRELLRAVLQVEVRAVHVQIEREGARIFFVYFQGAVVEHLVVALAVEVGGVVVARRLVKFRIGDDGAGEVVEEGVTVDGFVSVVRGAFAQPERHREGGLREGAGADGELVLLPFAVRADVLDAPVVEGGAAHRLRDFDVCASEEDGAHILVAVIERVGAHPYGQFGGSARVQRDGRARGIVLPRAHNAVRRAAVMHHEHGGFVLFYAFVQGGRRFAEVFGEVLHVLEVDGVFVIGKELRRVGIGVEIVDLVLKFGIESEAVVNGHVVVFPMGDHVVDVLGEEGIFVVLLLGVAHVGGRVAELRAQVLEERAARGGEGVPLRHVDDARRRVGRGRTGRERPVRGRRDEVALVREILVHFAVKLKVPVADLLGIRLRGRRLVVAVVACRIVGAGGEDPEREACGECDGERQSCAALPSVFSEIMCHINSL